MCERKGGRERFSVLKIHVWKGFWRDCRRLAKKQIPPSGAIEPRNLSLVFLRPELQRYPASFPHACNKHARTRGGLARIWSVRCLSCWEYARTPGAFGALWQEPAGEVKLHFCGDCCTGPQRRRFRLLVAMAIAKASGRALCLRGVPFASWRFALALDFVMCLTLRSTFRFFLCQTSRQTTRRQREGLFLVEHMMNGFCA